MWNDNINLSSKLYSNLSRMLINMLRVLYENRINEILDEIRYGHGILTQKGYIYGLIAIDQDVKKIASIINFL